MWFAVRQIIRTGPHYEERITLWDVQSHDDAVERATAEVSEYASTPEDSEVLEFVQTFHLFEPPESGREVFSLIRRSTLEPSDYLDRFFSTGDELLAD